MLAEISLLSSFPSNIEDDGVSSSFTSALPLPKCPFSLMHTRFLSLDALALSLPFSSISAPSLSPHTMSMAIERASDALVSASGILPPRDGGLSSVVRASFADGNDDDDDDGAADADDADDKSKVGETVDVKGSNVVPSPCSVAQLSS